MESGGAVLIVERALGNNNDRKHIDALRENGYTVNTIARGTNPVPMMSELNPVAACFQYDYPDLPGLADLQNAKQRVPSVPILMITQAHSEALAVWAFRTRVWDYFVEPVDINRFLAVVEVLAAVRQADARTPGRKERGVASAPYRIPAEARVRPPDTPSTVQTRALENALSFIDRHLHEKIAQADVASICGLSPFQFSRAFKRHFGTTFQEYLLRRRVAEAMHMLKHPGASITDVCYNVGFRDLSYFTRIFHRYVGQPPREYRERAKISANGKPPELPDPEQVLSLPMRNPER